MRGKNTPRRSSSPLEGGGQGRWAEDAARRRAGPPLLISRSFPIAGLRAPPGLRGEQEHLWQASCVSARRGFRFVSLAHSPWSRS